MTTPMQHIFPKKPKGKIITPLNKEKAETTPLSPKRGAESMEPEPRDNKLAPKVSKKKETTHE